jgi:NAD(P)-dependent dehydrogenase (short-subunit alcohol dehydrogenase family)
MYSLVHKNALITGASRGLGRAIALAYGRAGVNRLVLVARDRGQLEHLREELRHLAPRTETLVLTADLSRPAEIDRVAGVTLDQFSGKLDVLVNNASFLGPSPPPYLVDYPLEDFQEVLNTNLVAPFLLIRALLAAIVQRSGSIINVTSDAGITGYPGWGAYGISKFGLEGLSQTWAAELDGTGVRLNWVDPGNMNTAMHQAAEPNEDPAQWADPAEVVGIFLYLASDESKHICGKRFAAQTDWLSAVSSFAD